MCVHGTPHLYGSTTKVRINVLFTYCFYLTIDRVPPTKEAPQQLINVLESRLNILLAT